MFFSSQPDIVETSRTTEIHYSLGKTFALILFFFVGTFFITSEVIDIWSDTGPASLPAIPMIFLSLFGGGLVFYVARFFRLNHPPIEISPEGVFDSRCLQKPVPWLHLSAINTRGSGQARYVVLTVDKNQAPELRWPDRWWRRVNKFMGYGDVIIRVNGLAVSQPMLMDILEAYARAYGAPAANDLD